MASILGGLLVLVFFVLSAIHFYWAFGGKWGIDSALPTNKDGFRVLNPGVFDTIIVGTGLLFFAFIYGVKIGALPISLPNWFLFYVGWIIPSIFLLRVVGDFKFVGVFKKVKGTLFAKKDSIYFIPLCALISIFGFLLQYNLLNS